MLQKVPARPRSASQATPDDIGPGAYEVTRSAVNLKEPARLSSGFMPFSGGMYKGVGGVYEHHDLY